MATDDMYRKPGEIWDIVTPEISWLICMDGEST